MKYDAYSRPFRLPELAVKLVSVVQEWLRTRVKILEAERKVFIKQIPVKLVQRPALGKVIAKS